MFKNPIFYLLQDEKNISGEIFQRKPFFLGQWNVIVFQDNIPTYPAISIYLSIYLFLTHIYLNANTYIYIYILYIIYVFSNRGSIHEAVLRPLRFSFCRCRGMAGLWRGFVPGLCVVWSSWSSAQLQRNTETSAVHPTSYMGYIYLQYIYIYIYGLYKLYNNIYYIYGLYWYTPNDIWKKNGISPLIYGMKYGLCGL